MRFVAGFTELDRIIMILVENCVKPSIIKVLAVQTGRDDVWIRIDTETHSTTSYNSYMSELADLSDITDEDFYSQVKFLIDITD